jgi:hypothetical protein
MEEIIEQNSDVENEIRNSILDDFWDGPGEDQEAISRLPLSSKIGELGSMRQGLQNLR